VHAPLSLWQWSLLYVLEVPPDFLSTALPFS